MYATGDKLEKNDALAVQWIRKAVEQGYAEAQYSLGVFYADGKCLLKNKVEAVKWYRISAEQGYPPAQYTLGGAYFVGWGVPKSIPEAMQWFRKAAEQGHAPAQFILGVIYFDGRGVQIDTEEGAKWLRRSIDQGYIQDFKFDPSFKGENGNPKDEIEGLAWFIIAAERGDKNSIKIREAIEHRVGPEVAKAAKERSQQILRKIRTVKY